MSEKIFFLNVTRTRRPYGAYGAWGLDVFLGSPDSFLFFLF